MARTQPNIPAINMEQLLAALTRMKIVPTAEQFAQLNVVEDGHPHTSVPNTTPVTLPIVVLSDDEDSDYANYPADEGTDSDDTKSVPNAHTHHSQNPATRSQRPATESPHPAAELFGEEEEAPKPGTYAECTVCGAILDIVPRKMAQPWHVVFIGRKVGVFRSSAEADEQVKGVSGASCLCFKTCKAAEAAFKEARAAGKVRVRLSNKEMGAISDAAQAQYEKDAAKVGAMAMYL